MKIQRLAVGMVSTVVAASLAACGGTSAGGGSNNANSVTIYSADGLADWYKPAFAAFTKQTGIAVNYVESGSSEVVSRAEKERGNPQADVLVTLPPFIQRADADGMLGDLGVDTSAVPAGDKASNGHWSSMMDNYLAFIRNNTAKPAPATWQDLLNANYKGKLQYSTPGQAGDGTAVLFLLQYEFGKQGALNYLKRLQANNVGPSSSTGALQSKVSAGQLLVANGDVQMNSQSIHDDKSNFTVFFPSNAGKKPATIALPYDIGLASNAPHADNGKKLIQYLLSADVQKTVSAGAWGLPARSDVHPTDANYVAMTKLLSNVDIYRPDWNSLLGEYDSDISAYNSAVGS
ncbi:MAG: 2-aminoethylphosphonate ABC transporter substrate-binding protein [Sciscionella sp.]|nr:2-aminoethylphosphonate ABC transporter substrate-binding protein [Sciscionella sp.]